MYAAWRNLQTLFNDVAEEGSSEYLGQRYDQYVSDLSVRCSGSAELESVRLLTVLNSDGGGVASSIAVRTEVGPEVLVRVPTWTLQPGGREDELLQSLRGISIVPQTDLDNELSAALNDVAQSVSLAVSLGCLHLSARAFHDTVAASMSRVERDVACLVGGIAVDDDTVPLRGRVPLVAPALGTSSILSCLCLAPTLCETFSEYVGTLSRMHVPSGASALPADGSSVSTLQRTVSLMASRTPGALLIVCVNRTLRRALHQLEGFDTPAEAGSSQLVRDFVEALAACSGVEHVLVVGTDRTCVSPSSSPRIRMSHVKVRTRGSPSLPPLQVGADASVHRTVTALSLALTNAGVLVIPPGSPLNSTHGAPILIGSSHLDIVAVRDTFPTCIGLLNELAASKRDFAARTVSKFVRKASIRGAQSRDNREDSVRPALSRRSSSSRRRVVVRRRSSKGTK